MLEGLQTTPQSGRRTKTSQSQQGAGEVALEETSMWEEAAEAPGNQKAPTSRSASWTARGGASSKASWCREW